MGVSRALSKQGLVRYGACLPAAWLAVAAMAYGQTPAADPVKPFNDLINANCEKCHNSTDWAGSLAMDTLDLNHAGQDPEVWEKAIDQAAQPAHAPGG